ncbi:MAG: undecaprenyldiphospho-muramoylpentapeptide beta-N-acetylglucosaminyltransferase [Erysipelotrichaceae bacterium]|nr:undecaprenyldiphospho-muramoylpentapeptide beta-N-acetylglucosaminyltransferase [Erysipelotrichaceae bacterium]MDY5252327.1 undecaprenyldiphospho-muramoylpentapeptide beta-N-acetylglucosaminyltransferase [Erysipelotrichaceae bacterium]
MRVIIATGGSGGHIYPALALADGLRTQEKADILFVGSKGRMEATEIPNHDYEFIGLDLQGMNGSIFAKIKSACLLTKSYFACLKIIKNFKPDIVIGFGNYTSVSIILAAKHLHVPTMIHEQNSFAGKANKFLARKVDAIVGCYEENRKLANDHVYILGNPRASMAKDTIKDSQCLLAYDLDPNKKTAVIFMGSLGSESVNKVLQQAAKVLENKAYQTIIATGKKHFADFAYQSSQMVKIVPYIDGLKMMAACDVAVIRAGATTASEICVLGTCAIMIPSPYVPNNHQYYNALALVNKDAAILLEEKDLNVDNLVSKLDELMADDQKRKMIGQNAAALGTPNATMDIIKLMKELVKR